MNTPLENLIMSLQAKKAMWTKQTKAHKNIRDTYSAAILAAQSLLPEERQVIVDAWESGDKDHWLAHKEHRLLTGNTYFNQTFSNQPTISVDKDYQPDIKIQKLYQL